MKTFRLLILLLGITAALTSCHSTRTLATWEREGLAPRQYSKLVVCVSAATLATRSTIERTVAKAFSKKGLEAIAASDKLPELKVDTVFSLSSARSDLGSVNADLFLLIRHGKVLEGLTKEHGDLDPSGYGRMTLTRMESRLYDPVSGELLMTIDTESHGGGTDDVEDIAETLASELISQFRKKAILFPK